MFTAPFQSVNGIAAAVNFAACYREDDITTKRLKTAGKPP